MFALPRWVVKAGVVVVDDAELKVAPEGRTLHTSAHFDPSVESAVASWLERDATVRPANWKVSREGRV